MSTGNALSNALHLIHEGTSILHRQRILWVMPMLAMMVSMVVWGMAAFMAVEGWVQDGFASWKLLFLLPAWAISAFAHTYFQVALAHGLLAEQGEDTDNIDQHLARAWAQSSAIAWWAMISVAVRGVLVLTRRHNGVLPWLSALGGMAWGTATCLVIALIARGSAPWAAVKQSADIVNDQPGQAIAGLGGLWSSARLVQGAISTLGFIGVWAAVMRNHPIAGVAIGLGAGMLILIVGVIQQALIVAFSVAVLNQSVDQHELSTRS
jgi:hypothetical protein